MGFTYFLSRATWTGYKDPKMLPQTVGKLGALGDLAKDIRPTGIDRRHRNRYVGDCSLHDKRINQACIGSTMRREL